MGTFVRYFVVFLFLPGLYLRPDSGATNMRRDRLTRFVRRCTYVRLHLRSSVRPFVCPSVCPFVRSFIYSFVQWHYYFAALLFTIICGGGGDVVIRCAFTMCRVMRTASNDNELRTHWLMADLHSSFFLFCRFFVFFIDILEGKKRKSCGIALKFALPFAINFQFVRTRVYDLLNRGSQRTHISNF